VKGLDANLHLAARNLDRLKLVPVAEINAYDVLKHQRLVLTREALDALVASRKGKEPAAAAGK